MNNFKKNVIYSFLNQIVYTIVPLIVFPYVTRILGPENYGIVNYALSMVNIFVVLSTSGLVGYATREISKNLYDSNKMSKTFKEIFLIQFILTIFSSLCFIFIIFVLPESKENKIVLLITGINLFSNLFSFQWYFIGTENFKYITIRDLFIKLITVALIFICVKNKDDVLIYVTINCLSMIFTAVINSTFLFKNFYIQKIAISFKNHLKPVSLAISLSLISALSLELNTIVLGSLSTKEMLGFYNVGTKLIIIINSIFGSTLTVLLPRLSNETNEKNINNLLVQFSHYLSMVTIPASLGIIFYSSSIISLIFGEEYQPSIVVFKITSTCLMILPLIGIMYNYMYSCMKENIIMSSMIVGLVMNLILNVILVPKYLIIGAALTYVFTECSKFIVYYWNLIKYKKNNFFSKSYFIYLLSAFISTLIPYLVFSKLGDFKIFFGIPSTIGLYFYFLYFLKEKYFISIFKMVKISLCNLIS